MTAARAFLFLQGPPGPFFTQLAAGLRAAGYACHRINFTGGDWLDWQGPADNFTGPLRQWAPYLESRLAHLGITDIILFGDCRPLHRVALAIAAGAGIRGHVFEEGYIRPDWVTLEPGGVNGHSALPREPETYLRLAADLPPVPWHPPLPASFRRRAVEALAYFGAAFLLAPWYQGYRSHRPDSLVAEFFGWARRLALRPLSRRRSARALRGLARRPYFILPLQLDSDHQIRSHSPFDGMTPAIETVVASFARHAPQKTALIVKEHPLDNGLRPWRRIVRAAARSHGVADRVVFIEHGDIEALVAGAIGVVTVNSTTGTLALAAGRPVAVLGRAVYDLPGITHQGSLDAFWSEPGRPQLELYEAFRRVLAAHCLLRGGFSSRAGRAELVPAALARLVAAGLPQAEEGGLIRQEAET